MGPIVIYYHVNLIVREFNWTHKDCPQMWTVGYNELIKMVSHTLVCVGTSGSVFICTHCTIESKDCVSECVHIQYTDTRRVCLQQEGRWPTHRAHQSDNPRQHMTTSTNYRIFYVSHIEVYKSTVSTNSILTSTGIEPRTDITLSRALDHSAIR